jgi:membrane protease subunit HflC
VRLVADHQAVADFDAQLLQRVDLLEQRLRGEGDAEAARIYAEAYGSDPEFYAFHRSLEAYRRAFADGEGVLVLDPDTEFFRYFENGGRGE